MENIVLSICIASYNKAETTHALVTSLLTLSDTRFEVVVSDNASTDDTKMLLNGIDDKRFHFFENTANIGGGPNMVQAVYHAQGKYALYSNDRDIVRPEKLGEFIDFLMKNDDISGGICRSDLKTNGNYDIYDTLGALKKMCYICGHPSGFFFRRDLLEKIHDEAQTTYSRNESFVPFPWEYLLAEMAFMGKIAAYSNDTVKSTGSVSHKKYVSNYVELGNVKDRWFSPSNCLKRAQADTQHFITLIKKNNYTISPCDMAEVLANIMDSQRIKGTWWYRDILASQSQCWHYAVEPKKLKTKELFDLSRDFIRDYCAFIDPFIGESDKKETFMTIHEQAKKTDHRMIKTNLRKPIIAFLVKIKRAIIK